MENNHNSLTDAKVVYINTMLLVLMGEEQN